MVLAAAVALADRSGIDAVSMRTLADDLGVVPMALYKHVANKDELLTGMVDVVIAEFEAPPDHLDWQDGVKAWVLAAREAVLKHPWAWQVMASRTGPSQAALDHLDRVIATFRSGGLSAPLVHQAMHTLGSRVWGFNLEVFPSPPPPEDPEMRAALLEAFSTTHPNIVEIATAATHPPATASGPTIVGPGCDDQYEFEFGVDLLLDGIRRLHESGWPEPT